MRILSFLVAALMLLAPYARSETGIPVRGHISDPTLNRLIDRIRIDYLAAPPSTEDRKTAAALFAYIGPERVSDGRFVPPDEHAMSDMELEYMAETLFPDEGCHLRRLHFANSDAFIVLIVDATDDPAPRYHEECLMIATLAALGEEIDGEPMGRVDELHKRARMLVGAPL